MREEGAIVDTSVQEGLFIHFNFYWNVIALQCRVSFCHTSTWISYMYKYILSLLNLPPNPLAPIPSL